MTLQDFTNSPVVQMIGYVVGLVGIFLAIIFYIKQKVRKELSYFTTKIQLINPRLKNVSRIQVVYDAAKIEKLNISEITLFNSGNALLVSDDIPYMSPISIVCSNDGNILEITVDGMSDKANNCRIILSENAHNVAFDFLRPYQGCKIKIIHTSDVIGLVGTLKDSELKNLPYFSFPDLKETQKNLIFNAVLLVIFLIFVTLRWFWAVPIVLLFGASTINHYKSWNKAIKLKRQKTFYTEPTR
ncbi:MAG TPA: hypothetical protein VHE34_26060 [Puia sp.]|uniref:hypothetical protein n=1 Tax=Puia sp. TaxID=2045100 RepID=UPI002B7B4F16|nr:hypothetical protein [Puia sp.]HVU98725.1 hypothetical protein [Puia sp.]